MKNLLLMGLLSFFFGCVSTKKTTVYSAVCNNVTLSLLIIDEQKYSWADSHLALSWNNRPLIRKGYNGLPSKDSMAIHTPVVYFDISEQMVNTAHGKWQKKPVLFYVDPTVFSKKEFEEISHCLLSNYKSMEDTLYHNFIESRKHFNHFQYPQFAGIIYGKQEDFIIETKQTKQ